MADEKLEALLKEKIGDKLQNLHRAKDMLTAQVDRADLLAVCTLLKNDPDLDFNYLRCLSSIDRQTHLEAVYHVLSVTHGHQLCLMVQIPRDDPQVSSVSSLWKTANWHEREAFDLMGITFEGHPDLRRLLLPNYWEGHPLRKDYEHHVV